MRKCYSGKCQINRGVISFKKRFRLGKIKLGYKFPKPKYG